MGFVLGRLRVLSQDAMRNYDVQLEVLRDQPVQGGKWEYLHLAEFAKTFCGTPILCAYVNGKVGDGHNFRERVDKNGQKYYSFTDATAERIVGTISEEPDDVWVEEREGRTWIIAKGKIWRYYNRELADKIAEQGRIDVSAETNIEEMHEEDGREIFDKWFGLGVTILGDWVPPAVPGANLRAASLQQRAEEFKDMKLRVAALENRKTDKSKGVNRMNKTALAALQAKFKGYRVLAASENGNYVVLLSENGELCHYTCLAEDRGNIIPERIKALNLSIECRDAEAGENAETVCLSLEDITGHMQASIRTLTQERDTAITERDSERETVKNLQENESKRRVLDAKNAVTAKLASVNANRTEETRLNSDIAKGILADIEAGKYTNCSAEDGSWNGDKMAVLALMALVGEEQMKIDAKLNSGKETHFAWETGRSNSGSSDGIEGLLSALSE